MVWFVVFCVILGAALGSFGCCQAWRIRYKAEGKKNLGKRSVCLSCGKKLKWFENIPILSYVSQGGKCRKCGKRIGEAEIISEVLGTIVGGGLGIKFWNEYFRKVFCGTSLGSLGVPMCFSGEEVWLGLIGILLIVVIFTIMGIIAIYDAKWGEMPEKLLWVTVGLSIIYAGIEVYQGESLTESLTGLGGSILLLAGIYYILYKVSKEKWVGGGDWILCLAISLILGKPFLALLELSFSNILGLVIMIPARMKEKGKSREIPFGPFLAIAAIVIFCFSDCLANIL